MGISARDALITLKEEGGATALGEFGLNLRRSISNLDDTPEAGILVAFYFGFRNIVSQLAAREPLTPKLLLTECSAIRNAGISAGYFDVIGPELQNESNGHVIREWLDEALGKPEDDWTSDTFDLKVYEAGLSYGVKLLSRIESEWGKCDALSDEQLLAWSRVEGEVAIRYLNLSSFYKDKVVDLDLHELCAKSAREYGENAFRRSEHIVTNPQLSVQISFDYERTLSQEEKLKNALEYFSKIDSLSAETKDPSSLWMIGNRSEGVFRVLRDQIRQELAEGKPPNFEYVRMVKIAHQKALTIAEAVGNGHGITVLNENRAFLDEMTKGVPSS